MVGSLLSVMFAATPVLVDAPPARSTSILAALITDGTFIDFDDTLRELPSTAAEVETTLGSIPALLRSLNLEEVERRLTMVERDLARLSPAEAARLQRSVWFYRGFAKHLQDEAHASVGADEITWALAVDRQLELELPKAERFTKWVDERRRQAAQLERVSHRLISDQPALVWVDGTLKGSTPLDVDLTVGGHVVSVTSPGRERLHRSITVRSGTSTKLEVGPPLPAPMLARRSSVLEAARSGRLAAPLPDEVVVVREHDGLQVIRLSSSVGAGVSLSMPTPRALSLALAEATVPANAVEGPAASTAPSRRSLAPITSFASAAVLVIGSAIAFGVAQGQFSSAAQVPQVDVTRYGELMNGGRGWMVASGVVGALALVAAGVGVVFLLD